MLRLGNRHISRWYRRLYDRFSFAPALFDVSYTTFRLCNIFLSNCFAKLTVEIFDLLFLGCQVQLLIQTLRYFYFCISPASIYCGVLAD